MASAIDWRRGGGQLRGLLTKIERNTVERTDVAALDLREGTFELVDNYEG